MRQPLERRCRGGAGAAKVAETQFGFLFAECMRVHAQRQLGVCVAELLCDPPQALAGRECEACEGVPRVVEAERPHALTLSLAA